MSLPDAPPDPALDGSAGDVVVDAAPAEPSRALELTLRVAGVVIAVLAALFSGVLEVLFASWRVGGYLIGASALAAVPANLAIAWFAHRTVGRRWAVAPPWVVWTVLMFIASGVRTEEGDYLLAADNWVGLVMILLGSMTFAVFVCRLILTATPKPSAPQPGPAEN